MGTRDGKSVEVHQPPAAEQLAPVAEEPQPAVVHTAEASSASPPAESEEPASGHLTALSSPRCCDSTHSVYKFIRSLSGFWPHKSC